MISPITLVFRLSDVEREPINRLVNARQKRTFLRRWRYCGDRRRERDDCRREVDPIFANEIFHFTNGRESIAAAVENVDSPFRLFADGKRPIRYADPTNEIVVV